MSEQHLGFSAHQLYEPPNTPPFCHEGRVRRFRIGPAPWLVCEHHQSDSGPSLVFFGPGVGRRVRNFPPNWCELSDEALYALSWSV